MVPPGELSNVVIILHQPQLAENTGMAMRAMANTGVRNLRIVSPQHSWPSETAHLASAEKSDQLNIEVYQDLREAVSDLNIVFGTSARSRNMIQQVYTPEAAFSSGIIDGKVGVLFGPEKSGLGNEALSLCNYVIEIPSVDFASYNLAQAVLIICYQLISCAKSRLHTGKTSLATHQQVNYFLSRLETELAARNHFPSAQKRVLMMQTIQNFINRATPTHQEIQSLQGVIDTLMKK